MAHVLFPLPSQDFDPTEVAVSWQVLTALGHRVSFSTEDGAVAAADAIMLSGRGLDPWSRVPGVGRVRVLGLLLRANRDARSAYVAMMSDPAFQSPSRWDGLRADAFDGIVLGGGHRACGMRPYLESQVLQALIADCFAQGRAVGAICHGVLLVARSRDATNRSVLFGRKTTALTWHQERTADGFARVGRPGDRSYYRTYLEQPGEPLGHMSVQHEVTRYLRSPDDFIDVPRTHPHRRAKTSGMTRDSMMDDRPAWVIRDDHYVSARWPGDAHTFAKVFADVLRERTLGTRSAAVESPSSHPPRWSSHESP